MTTPDNSAEARTADQHHHRLVAMAAVLRESVITFGGVIQTKLGVDAAHELEAMADRLTFSAEQNTGGMPGRAAIEAIIRGQMREWWDEICSDTGCHPLDIVQEGRRKLSYQGRHWTDAVAGYSADVILSATGGTSAGEGWRDIASAKIDCETEVDLWCEGIEGEGWLLRGIIYPGEPMWIKTVDGGDYFPHENGGWVTHWRPTPSAPVDRKPLPTTPTAPADHQVQPENSGKERA